MKNNNIDYKLLDICSLAFITNGILIITAYFASTIFKNIFLNIILWSIFIFYIYIWYRSGLKKDNLKKIVLNFLAVCSLYNIFLSFNPFNLLELSSGYIISNVLYFQISFFIMTSSFNISKKFSILFDFALFISKLGKINKNKNNSLCMFIIAGILSYFLAGVILSLIAMINLFILKLVNVYIPNISSLIPYLKDFSKELNIDQFIFSIIIFILFLIFNKDSLGVNRLIGSINNSKIDSIIELFDIKKIENNEIVTNEKVNIMNGILFIFIRYINTVIILSMVFTNDYYWNYVVQNNSYCENINKTEKIIMLKDNKVLLLKEEYTYRGHLMNDFEESNCNKKAVKIILIK